MDTLSRATSDAGRRDLRRSWLSNLLFLPSTAAAFLLGEGVFTALGAEADERWWVLLVAGLPALVVFAAPCLVVGRFALRAGGAGVPHADLPLLTALTLTFGFGGLNLAGLLVHLV